MAYHPTWSDDVDDETLVGSAIDCTYTYELINQIIIFIRTDTDSVIKCVRRRVVGTMAGV